MFFRSPEKQIIKFPRVIHPFHYSLGSALKKTRSQLFCEDVRFSRILEHHTYFEVSIIQAKRNKYKENFSLLQAHNIYKQILCSGLREFI